MHARRAHSGGSSGGSSGGYVSYSGGSSGGSAGVTSGGSTGGGSTGYASYSHSSHSYSTPVVQSVSLGSSTAYESPVIQSSYQSYTPMGSTVIEGSTISSGTVIEGSTIHSGTVMDGGTISGGTVIQGGTTIQNGSTVQDAPADSAPADPQAAGEKDSAGYESSKQSIESDAAVLTVAVPSDAVVLVNGHKTTSEGTIRQFKSRGLKDGYVYTYVVKATYQVDGQAKTETKSVKLRSGSQERVEFTAPQPAPATTVSKPVESEQVLTVVRLNVPADAQVTLAGNATSGRGDVRTFRTKQLKPGQQWADYTIRVTAVVDGQTVTKERTIDVIAGSTNELTFDFKTSAVASR